MNNAHVVTCKAVLDGALEADITDVLVIGHQRDGDLYVASSGKSENLDVGLALLLMERAKLRLLAMYERAMVEQHE